MATCHTALIDYRFRVIPRSAEPYLDFLDDEDKTFIENGIVVELKYNLSDIDKKRIRAEKLE